MCLFVTGFHKLDCVVFIFILQVTDEQSLAFDKSDFQILFFSPLFAAALQRTSIIMQV